MTRIRDDVHQYFEREAVRHLAPGDLRATVLAEARGRALQRRRPAWNASAVAILLGVAIVAGLLAVGAMRHAQTTPGHAPRLLFHDHLAAAASGRPSLPDQFFRSTHYPSLVLAAGLPVTPAQGTVYALDPALGPTPAQVGLVWGITAPSSVVDNEATIGDIQYYPSSGAIDYSRPGNPQSVRVTGPGLFPRAITTAQSAISMARDFIVSRGLFSQDDVTAMRASAERASYPGSVPMWTIHLTRTLGGVPVDGSWMPGATLQVADNGRIDSIVIGHRSISGSERAGLIDAAEAWRQIKLGHWYASSLILDGIKQDQPAFVAGQAELCYREEDVMTAQAWLVPMWCFADTKTAPGFTVRLYYPALQPGSFDWKVPSH